MISSIQQHQSGQSLVAGVGDSQPWSALYQNNDTKEHINDIPAGIEGGGVVTVILRIAERNGKEQSSLCLL